MQTIQSRPKVGLFAVLTVFAWLATATWAPSANATSTLYDNNCSGCHGSTSGVHPIQSALARAAMPMVFIRRARRTTST